MKENVKKIPKPVKYALFLAVLGLICGGLLGLVNYITSPIIEDAIHEESLAALEAENNTCDWSEVETSNDNIDNIYEGKIGNDLELVAYKITTYGYKNGEITTIIFIKESKIANITIISLKDQTSGIGTQVENEDYLNSFIDKDIAVYENDDAIEHNSNSVDVISGATYSSRAIISAVIIASTNYSEDYR